MGKAAAQDEKTEKQIRKREKKVLLQNDTFELHRGLKKGKQRVV